MSRARRTGAVVVLTAAVALAIASAVRPAVAAPEQGQPQPPPLVPIEVLLPLLEPLQPVFEVISPIVWPACANAVLVSVLPGALGVDVPPELALVTGPLLVLCGSVPEPVTNRRVCALDVEAQHLLTELTTPLIGSGLPVEVAPFKWLSGFIDNIVDLIPAPGVPTGSTVAATLQCVDPPPDATTTTTPADPVGERPAPTVPPVVLPPLSFVDPPTFAQLQTLPPVVPAPAVASPVVPVAAPEIAFVDEPRFRYPVVMGLPLAFIGLLVFFGRALTRPLEGGAR